MFSNGDCTVHGLLVTWYAQFQGNEVRDMSGAANTQKTKECCGRTWEEAQVQAALRPDLGRIPGAPAARSRRN